jgi:hypothetical protein
MRVSEKVPLATLPVRSTSFTSDALFEHPGGEARLRFEFEAASALASVNSALAAAGKLSWAQPGTGSVIVVDHSHEN